MTKIRAEQIADETVNDFRSSPLSYREAIVKHLLPIEECNGCTSEALNSGDGTYKP